MSYLIFCLFILILLYTMHKTIEDSMYWFLLTILTFCVTCYIYGNSLNDLLNDNIQTSYNLTNDYENK